MSYVHAGLLQACLHSLLSDMQACDAGSLHLTGDAGHLPHLPLMQAIMSCKGLPGLLREPDSGGSILQVLKVRRTAHRMAGWQPAHTSASVM